MTAPTTVAPEPSEASVLEMMESLKNWGRWGDDDRLGTLNLITDAVRRAAVGLVSRGRTVSLARTITPSHAPDNPTPPVHFMIESGQAAPPEGHAVSRDWYGIAPHGHSVTHLDSLGHLFWNGLMYNGRPASRVDQITGAKDGSIEDAGGGIVTRAVLLDVPRAVGLDFLPIGYRITPDDLAQAERQGGAEVRPGDAVLLRTGRDVDRTGRGPHRPENDGAPGLSARCLPWIHERGVAVLGSDAASDAFPSVYETVYSPIHTVGIVGMGLWILDNAYLEELAVVAVEEEQSEFLLTMGPLKLKRGTGSPVNPIAVL